MSSTPAVHPIGGPLQKTATAARSTQEPCYALAPRMGKTRDQLAARIAGARGAAASAIFFARQSIHLPRGARDVLA